MTTKNAETAAVTVEHHDDVALIRLNRRAPATPSIPTSRTILKRKSPL